MENMENMDLLKELKEQQEYNEKYTIALQGLMQAYKALQNEDQQLDIFLLSIMDTLAKKIDLSDKKIKPEEVDFILSRIENIAPEYISFDIKFERTDDYLESLK